MQKLLPKLKSRLTKAKKKLDDATTPEGRVAAAHALIAEVSRAASEFDRHGWPDCWSNWERAANDAHFVISREG